jgi:hypothetical protein
MFILGTKSMVFMNLELKYTKSAFLVINLDLDELIESCHWNNLSHVDYGCLLLTMNEVEDFRKTPINLRSKLKEYTIQVIAGNSQGYLKYYLPDREFSIGSSIKSDNYQIAFTKDEIEGFKKRNDIAVDWNKAIIKKVDEDD